MAEAFSYIGAVIAVSATLPATEDAAGFAALTYTTIGKIVSWAEVGDTTNNISIPLLAGRTKHLNGSKDGGEIAFTYVYDSAGDAGQLILVANNNTQTNLSFKITDPNTKVAYNYGLVANVRDMARSDSTYAGLTGVVRVNSATIRV